MAARQDPTASDDEIERDSDAATALLARLQAARDSIAELYETAPFGCHTVGPDGTYAFINDLELFWLGASREDLIGRRRPREFLTPESQLQLDHYMDRHGRHGFTDLPLELLNPLGETRPVLQSFNGTLQSRRSLSFDRTAYQLERQQQRVAALCFESTCGLCVTNAQGDILRVNAGFTALTGYSNDEMVGRNMRILRSGAQTSGFYRQMWRAVGERGHWQGEIRNRRKDGQVITKWLNIAAVRDAQGQVSNYVGAFYDISALKISQEEITRLAFHDSLTQLPNRRLLLQRIDHALAIAGRHELHSALLFIDLDHFKSINDTHGHEAGDLLLIEAGLRMQRVLREGDTVARVGGDEFVVLLEGMGASTADAATQARLIGEKLLAALAVPYDIKDFEFRCTGSIGICMVEAGISATQLLTHADLAMYQAKRQGRHALQFFDPVMQSAANLRVDLEQALQKAVALAQFELHYQPQVDLQGRVLGVEALLRWQRPGHGWVSPAEIIALAEETGLIVPIGQWVLQTACAQMKAWSLRPETRQLTMAVNVSARQFARDDFVQSVLKTLSDSGADPGLLDLEVTESMMLNVDNALHKMQALRLAGVRFSLDDFGTGYSSLAILTRLPIATLKIDQSFVRHMAAMPGDQIIVQTIIGMAHSLGLTVIAEGVETRAQCDQLKAFGCQLFQGYLFGRPQSIDTLDALVAEGLPGAAAQ